MSNSQQVYDKEKRIQEDGNEDGHGIVGDGGAGVQMHRITRSQTGTSKRTVALTYGFSDDDDSDNDNDGNGAQYQSSSRHSRAKRTRTDAHADGKMTNGSVQTCIRVNRLPILFERLMKVIDEQESDTVSEQYNKYAIETLLLNCVMDVKNF